MSLQHYRVMVVDDNPGDVELAIDRLSDAPGCQFEVQAASRLASARLMLGVATPDVIILDLNLPDSIGLQTLFEVHAVARGAPIVVVSGAIDPWLRQQVVAAGAEDVFSKVETNSRLFSRSILFVIERQRARQQHRQLEAMLDATPDGMVVTDQQGQVRFVNAAALALLGRPRDEVMAEPMVFAVSEGGVQELVLPRGGDARTCAVRVVTMVWGGEPALLASLHDVTEARQAEALRERSVELEVQNERMRQSSELKSAFVANMSHEIRTPMNAVIGLTQLLGETRLDTEQRAMLDRLQLAGRTLMGLLDNVLDLSKIEAGEVALEVLPFELPRLVHDVASLMAGQAQAKGLGLSVELADDVPRWVLGDPTRLRQILTNLLSNAVKFTAHGSVGLSLARDPGDPTRLQFHVRDSGIGIDAAAMSRLFEPFTQADASTTRRFGGTGLGLSIVRRLAELMGGGVQVASRPGEGTCFTVTVPLEEAAAADASASGVRLLVLGPPDSALAVAAGRLGWTVERPAPGRATLQALQQRLSTSPLPDAWVRDPAGDGLSEADRAELVEAVAQQRLAPPLPLPADAVVNDAQLFNALDGWLRAAGQPTQRLLDSTRVGERQLAWLHGLRVLVVDDSDINRDVAQRLLRAEGAQVETCADGVQALRRLAQSPSAFDAVLMDVQMPMMDGCEAALRVRTELRLTQLPIIAVTAGALVAERQRALAAGMDDYLVKPLNPAALVRALRHHMERTSGRALPVHARADDPAPAAAELDPGPIQIPSVLKGDVDWFVRLARKALDEFGDLARLPVALPAPGQHDELRMRLHKLRGGTGALGVADVAACAGQAETLLGQGDPSPAELRQALEALAATLQQFEGRVRSLQQRHAAAAGVSPGDAGVADAGDEQSVVRRVAERLQQMLLDQDFAALAQVRERADLLRRHLGASRFELLRAAVEDLDFGRASRLLQADSP